MVINSTSWRVHLGPLSLVSGASPLFPHLQIGNNNAYPMYLLGECRDDMISVPAQREKCPPSLLTQLRLFLLKAEATNVSEHKQNKKLHWKVPKVFQKSKATALRRTGTRLFLGPEALGSEHLLCPDGPLTTLGLPGPF